LTKVDEKIRHQKDVFTVYLECEDAKQLNQTLQIIKHYPIKIEAIRLEKSKLTSSTSIGVELITTSTNNLDEVVNDINNLDNVTFAIIVR
jgi:hypothetical protein